MNPFATGTSAGHAPRRRDKEHEERRESWVESQRWERRRKTAQRGIREDPMKRREKRKKKRRKGAREKKRKRRQKSGQAERRRPWLVIYIESYLHLNVFIFNARPRNGLSVLGGFVSAPHLLRPLTCRPNLSRASVSLRFVSSWKTVRSLLRIDERKLANASRRLTHFSDAPSVVRTI